MTVHNIGDKQSFESSVLKNEGYVVVDYFATWCGPCKVIAPRIEQLSHSFSNITFYKLDVDQVPDVAADQGIRAMPTIILYKNGQVEKEIVGADLNGIQNMITAASTNPSA